MEPKRILIWEQNWLGDVLFSTPFIKAIRKRYKDAHIAVIVNPASREIVKGNPRIDEIIIFDEKNEHRGIMGRIKFIMELRKKKFDTAFFMHRSCSRAIICEFAGVKNRIGYFYKKRNLMLTDIVEIPDKPLHKIEYFLNIAKHVKADIADKNMEFFVADVDKNYVKEMLERNSIREKDGYIVLNPGANWPPKRWPEENFADLAEKLIKKYNIKVVISGGEDDLAKALRIQDLTPQRLVITCGRTTLKQLGSLFERAKVIISADTGPLHLARAVGAKVIALFGPTSHDLTGPYGDGIYSIIHKNVRCKVPCYEVNCKDNRCMKAITVKDVMKEIEKFLCIDSPKAK